MLLTTMATPSMLWTAAAAWFLRVRRTTWPVRVTLEPSMVKEMESKTEKKGSMRIWWRISRDKMEGYLSWASGGLWLAGFCAAVVGDERARSRAGKAKEITKRLMRWSLIPC